MFFGVAANLGKKTQKLMIQKIIYFLLNMELDVKKKFLRN